MYIIIITPRLDSLGVYIIDITSLDTKASNDDITTINSKISDLNTSLANTNSNISSLQNSQYLKHLYVEGTISNNVITYSLSALATHGIFWIEIDTSNGGHYQRLILSSWVETIIKELSQNDAGTITVSGYIESGNYTITQNMGSTSISWGHCNVYYIISY